MTVSVGFDAWRTVFVNGTDMGVEHVSRSTDVIADADEDHVGCFHCIPFSYCSCWSWPVLVGFSGRSQNRTLGVEEETPGSHQCSLGAFNLACAGLTAQLHHRLAQVTGSASGAFGQ